MNLIYDVGAHRGEDTEYYLKKGFKVVAVEAHPDLAAGLRSRFASAIDDGRLVVVQSAVAAGEGEVHFYANSSSVWGTIDERWAERNEKMGAPSKRITVPAVTFGSVLARHGVPHYLKVDIEGADMLCIEALADVKSRPKFVSVESNKISWRGLRREFQVLDRLGYRRFKIVDQSRIEQQTEPPATQEGRFTGHRFSAGGSGLFGADLPGTWLTRRQALLRYAAIFVQYKLFGDNTRGQKLLGHVPQRLNRWLTPGWYDTHAMLG